MIGHNEDIKKPSSGGAWWYMVVHDGAWWCMVVHDGA